MEILNPLEDVFDVCDVCDFGRGWKFSIGEKVGVENIQPVRRCLEGFDVYINLKILLNILK